jgi:hypothetical protein
MALRKSKKKAEKKTSSMKFLEENQEAGTTSSNRLDQHTFRSASALGKYSQRRLLRVLTFSITLRLSTTK